MLDKGGISITDFPLALGSRKAGQSTAAEGGWVRLGQAGPDQVRKDHGVSWTSETGTLCPSLQEPTLWEVFPSYSNLFDHGIFKVLFVVVVVA